MRRLTISIDDALAETFDRLMSARGYRTRSEAFRDLLREELDREQRQPGRAKHCVGVLSYVYDHHQRDLTRRLTGMQHQHHDVTVATMHTHLDHDQCVEAVIVRGRTAAVQAFAQRVIAEKGVRHGHFHAIPAEAPRAGEASHWHLNPYT